MDRDTVREQLADVPVELTVELSRAQMSLNRSRRLRAGDVIRLSMLAGEVMDVRVNGALLAHGEITACGHGMEGRGVRIIRMADRGAPGETEA